MNIYPHSKLMAVLSAAYDPCVYMESFGGSCRESRWVPKSGHVPRGFLGATAALQDVQLVMVLAEPGTPQPHERYRDDVEHNEDQLRSTVDFVHDCYRSARPSDDPWDSSYLNSVHHNARWFLERLYPELTFDQQLRHVWITESRLCSLQESSGRATKALYHSCEKTYLAKQLGVLRHADVVAFGPNKAQKSMERLGVATVLPRSVKVAALSQRNYTALAEARRTWKVVLQALRKPKGEHA